MKVSVAVDNSKYVGQELEHKLKQALTTCGMMAEGYAKALCPVDTGRLRNSITHAEDSSHMEVGTNVEYGPFVELGTSHSKAQPYLRPSIENHIAEYEHVINSILKI